MADKATPKRQHSAPEYLEKRKQERDRRKSETGLRYRLRRSRKSDVATSISGTEVYRVWWNSEQRERKCEHTCSSIHLL